MKGRQAYIQQKLFNAEFASGEYRNARDKNMRVIRVMRSPGKRREAFAAYMPAAPCRSWIIYPWFIYNFTG
jgi:hypothetical protein